MTLKQEQSILKRLQDLNARIENNRDKYVSHDNYNLIKQEQEKLNYLLNSFIQCDE